MRLTELYGMLPIRTDVHLNPDAVWRFARHAQEFTLSAYDATYLELAERRGLALATLERRLITEAEAAGVARDRPSINSNGLSGSQGTY